MTGTIKFTPISLDETPNANLIITINGEAGANSVTGTATITLIDTHKPSENINLKFDPASLSEEEGPKTVTVTATLDGRVQARSITFALIVNNTTVMEETGDETALVNIAERDTDYSLTPNSVTIPRGKVSGTTTITIDPKEKDRGPNVAAVKFGLGGSPVTFFATEDLGGDANDATKGNGTEDITVQVAEFKITDTPIAKPKGLTADPNEVREEAGATEITLKVYVWSQSYRMPRLCLSR